MTVSLFRFPAHRLARVVICAGILALIAVVSLAAGGNAEDADDEGLFIVATTGHIADAVAEIAPDAEIFTVVGPGLDPHTYEASTQDIEQFRNADILFWNALNLEAQMADAIMALGDSQLGVGDLVPESMLLPFEGEFDPHIWNSTEIWSMCVQFMADKLAEIDPDGADAYQANAAAYIAEIEAMDAYARETLGAVPVDSRTIVSGHDAFNYFADAYGFEALAIEGISTEDEASIQDLRELADYVADNQVIAIFFENITNPQATEALQEAVASRGWDVAIAEETLFSDSLGDSAPQDTYLGSFRHNVDTIAEALGAR